jgi:hypothetical protein
MDLNLFFTWIAVLLSFVAFIPYIRGINHGKTVPHMFSWIIWGLTTTIVSIAQFKSGGGVGSWPTLISGLITFYIAWLAFRRRSDVVINPADWIFFVAALLALPFWYFTSVAFWAVLIVTVVDVLGFGPTLRKAWSKPYEENVTFFSLFMVRSIFAVFALEAWTWTTLLFPVAIGTGCLLLIGIVIFRRKSVEP